MTLDYYVAICKTLQYTTIMSGQVCSVLVAVAWVGSWVHSSAQIFLALSLPFCGPNVIDHYLCDLQPLLQLACTDTYVVNLLLVSNSGAICTVSFVMLMFSCIFILHCLRKHSLKGAEKPSPPVFPTSPSLSYSLVLAYLYTPALQPPSLWIS